MVGHDQHGERSPTCGASSSSSRSTSPSKRGETSWIDASSRRSDDIAGHVHAAPRIASVREPMKKASLEIHRRSRLSRAHADRRRLRFLHARRAAASGPMSTRSCGPRPGFGHEMIVIAPGKRARSRSSAVRARSSSRIPSPKLPVDRRYRYFDDERALHATLDAWRPGSRRSLVALVERDDGRALAGRGEPLAGHACRSARGLCLSLARRHRADRDRSIAGSAGSGGICAASAGCSISSFAPTRSSPSGFARAASAKAETMPMGVEAGLFSPALRSAALRAQALASLGLDATRMLLVGVGRFSAEKRWDMVIRPSANRPHASVRSACCSSATGREAAQAGAARGRLAARRRACRRSPIATSLPADRQRRRIGPRLRGRNLLHGRGRGAGERSAADRSRSRRRGRPARAGAGIHLSGGGRALAGAAIERFIDRGPELQRAAAARAAGCGRWTSISPSCSRATKRCRGHSTPACRSSASDRERDGEPGRGARARGRPRQRCCAAQRDFAAASDSPTIGSSASPAGKPASTQRSSIRQASARRSALRPGHARSAIRR